jgi:uncharacterized protein (DUF1800 family)
VTEAHEAGLNGTLERLFERQDESEEFEATSRLLRRTAMDTGNIADLKASWLHRMVHSRNPLVEKLSLFWHNHFATSNAKVQSVAHMAVQNDLIRQHALGSFGELLNGMARDVAMLVWLDGNANRKRQPNENFAREVMELFSLDVGNYSEHDIQEAARAFTGWHVRNDAYWFNRGQHDFGDKVVLGTGGNLDGDDIIQICLEQDACPRFLAKKILKTFLTASPREQDVALFAERIRQHNYEIGGVLRELFASRSFYRGSARHSIIKSPLDFALGAQRSLSCRPNLPQTANLLAQLGQDVFEPPTVKGWDGGRLWISSASLLQRNNFAAALCTSTRYGAVLDSVTLADSQNWSAPEEVVEEYLEFMLARDVSDTKQRVLTSYLRDSGGGRNERVRGMIQLVMTMPEYQLM